MHYTELFQTYIVNATRQALETVQRYPHEVPEVDRQQAWHTLRYALDQPAAWVETRRLLLDLAPKMEMAGFRHEWIPFLEKGIERARQWEDPETAAALILQMGYLYLRLRLWDPARRWLDEAHDLYKTLGDHRKQAVALVRLAQVARYEDERAQARALVAAAERLLAAGDEEHGYCCFVRGLLAWDGHNWDDAYNQFERGWEIWSAAGNQKQMALCRMDMGLSLVYRYEYNPDLSAEIKRRLGKRAIAHYREALSLFKALNDLHHQGFLQINLGVAFFGQKAYTKALEMYVAAEAVFEKVNDPLTTASVQHNLGMVYRALRCWREAEDAFQRAIKLRRTLERPMLALWSVEGLGLVYLDWERYVDVISLYAPALAELERIGEDQDRRDAEWHRLVGNIERDLAAAQRRLVENQRSEAGSRGVV